MWVLLIPTISVGCYLSELCKLELKNTFLPKVKVEGLAFLRDRRIYSVRAPTTMVALRPFPLLQCT